MKAYELGFANVWTGASQEIPEGGGWPAGWIAAPIPTWSKAVWTGQGWAEATPAILAAAEELLRKAAVPTSVTPRQIRQALTRAGHRQAVETAISAGSQDLKDWYEFSDEFQRNHPLVQELLAALGLTEKDADDVWTLAGSL